LKSRAKEERPPRAYTDDPPQHVDDLTDERDVPLPPSLNPPPELGLAADSQPAALEIEIFDEEMGRFAGSETCFRRHEMDRKAPFIGGLQKLVLCGLIKDEHRLRIVFVKLTVSQFREGVLSVRGQVPPFHRKLKKSPAGVQDEPDAAFPEWTAARARMAIRGHLDSSEPTQKVVARDGVTRQGTAIAPGECLEVCRCRAIAVDGRQRRAEDVFVVIKKTAAQFGHRNRFKCGDGGVLTAGEFGIAFGRQAGRFRLVRADANTLLACALAVIQIPRAVMRIVRDAADSPAARGALAPGRHA
jgi:hypothetical protein